MTAIHAHIEVKKNGKWFHYGAPDVDTTRLYIVCAFLNGYGIEYLRESTASRIQPCASISGIPEDASDMTMYSYWTDCECCPPLKEGCLTSGDLKTLQERMDAFYADELGGAEPVEKLFHTGINGGTIADHNRFEDSRVIFWFSECRQIN